MYSTAHNLCTFTWFVHFEITFRLKGTEKIHTEKFPSNIYSILYEFSVQAVNLHLSEFYLTYYNGSSWLSAWTNTLDWKRVLLTVKQPYLKIISKEQYLNKEYRMGNSLNIVLFILRWQKELSKMSEACYQKSTRWYMYERLRVFSKLIEIKIQNLNGLSVYTMLCRIRRNTLINMFKLFNFIWWCLCCVIT